LEVPILEGLRTTLELAGYSTEALLVEARRALAAVLYKRHILTLAQATELAGMSMHEFIPFLASLGIATLDYPAGELEHDLRSIEEQWQTG